MFSIPLKFKQLLVRVLLSSLRGLLAFKRHGGGWLRWFSKPFSFVGVWLVRLVGIPVYRVFFFIKRQIANIVRPTKHGLLHIITNRYTVHVVMIILVACVIGLNIKTRAVRAETFGQKSLLYALVSVDDSQTIEIVQADQSILPTGVISRYESDTVLDNQADVDLSDLQSPYTTPTTGGTPQTPPSVPARSAVETYVVQEGDTLGNIADHYGLNLSTILWANQLTLRSTIRPGQELSILPTDGVLYKVTSGDTLSRIARRFNVDADKILSQNQLASADRLHIGDRLLIPGAEPYQAAPRITAPVSNLFAPSTKTPPATGGWIWPTDWHVITQYFGWKHTGVDIDGDYTTNNYAARDGVVIYSGWRGGYGLTVEIDHGDGYVTRYGHHSKIYVKVGDYVTAGQAVGRTGTTGRSTGTHLHFEVIKNGRFQNPLDYVR